MIKKSRSLRIQGIIVLVILIVNIIASSKANFFYENYSFVGNALSHSFIFYSWGILCGTYFLYSTFELMKLTMYSHKYGKLCLFLSCIGMPLSVLLPYQPDINPIIAQLHIYISISATIIYVLVLYHFFYDLMFKNYTVFQTYFGWYSTIIIICLIVLMFYGCVNSFMEFLFSTMLSCLLFLMRITLLRTKKDESLDPPFKHAR